MGGWQPIETAPHDRRIILWTGREIYIGHWGKNVETDHEAFIIAEWGDGDQAMVGSATHWMEAPRKLRRNSCSRADTRDSGQQNPQNGR